MKKYTESQMRFRILKCCKQGKLTIQEMKNTIIEKIHSYKYVGNYLKNYRDLISIIQLTTERINEPGLKELAIHLVIESRNHRWGMSYSKAFEMATDIFKEIKQETQTLINSGIHEYIEPLTFMNEELPMYKSQLNKNTFDSWIHLAEPWIFFILETNEVSQLFINDFENNLCTQIQTDEHFNWKIKNDEKPPYEMIYSKINEWRVENWSNKTSLQQGV